MRACDHTCMPFRTAEQLHWGHHLPAAALNSDRTVTHFQASQQWRNINRCCGGQAALDCAGCRKTKIFRERIAWHLQRM